MKTRISRFTNFKIKFFPIAIIGLLNLQVQASEHQSLTLESAVNSAVKRDIWVSGNQHKQDSIQAKSISAGTLPDPKVSIGVANIGADSFDFGQEPMTQLKVGVSQMFPRGNSRALKKQKLQELAAGFPYQRQNRQMKLAVLVGNLWLDAFKAQESIVLINKDRELFEQLVEVAEASYTSAFGKTRQQDIIRSQLELIRIDDRLTVLNQKKEASLEKLKEWISNYYVKDEFTDNGVDVNHKKALSTNSPDILLDFDLLTPELTPEALFGEFSKHPIVLDINQKIIASETNIKLEKQKYKPAFGVNTSYGYRDNAPNSASRADLFSVGVTFDVPLFTKNKQDQDVKSAISESQSLETQKWLLLRKMMASFEKNLVQLKRLNQRQTLYQNQLLPQMHEQAEASLNAYTNDDGDFAEVVRSRIAVLNAEIEELDINVEIQKTIIQLNYFLNTNYEQIISNKSYKEEMK
jgi:outer membrane protein TolC